jgi:hypothetical protein
MTLTIPFVKPDRMGQAYSASYQMFYVPLKLQEVVASHLQIVATANNRTSSQQEENHFKMVVSPPGVTAPQKQIWDPSWFRIAYSPMPRDLVKLSVKTQEDSSLRLAIFQCRESAQAAPWHWQWQVY